MSAVCLTDGAATRLRCAQCDAGICPACLVRTPIGFKCSVCAGGSVASPRRTRMGLRLIAGAGLVAALAYLGVVRLSNESTRAAVPVPPPMAAPGPTSQAMIGEEAQDGQLVFVVDAFSCNAKASGGATGKLCTLRFNVRNDSDSPARFLGRFQYLVDEQARTFGAEDELTRAASENSSRSLSELNINPGVGVALVFVFDVPETVEPTEAQFRGTGRSRLGVNVRLERRK
jgi:hypothetical protein